MSETFVPAPLWRRLIAAVYDGLLHLGLVLPGSAAVSAAVGTRAGWLDLGRRWMIYLLDLKEYYVSATLWRRLIAAVYDGLLLLGLWMVALLLDVLIRDAFDAPRNWAVLRAYLFVVGLGFFAWFWTHGGQTLGMRVWRLRIAVGDARPLSWLNAGVRYAAMMAVWGITLTPLLARLPHLRDEPHAGPVALTCAALTAAGLLAMFIDRQRRAPHDWLSGTTTVVLPKADKQVQDR